MKNTLIIPTLVYGGLSTSGNYGLEGESEESNTWGMVTCNPAFEDSPFFKPWSCPPPREDLVIADWPIPIVRVIVLE